MPVSSNEFLDIEATIECWFTLKHVRGIIIIANNILTKKYFANHWKSSEIGEKSKRWGKS